MESSVDKLAEQVKGIVAERQQHLDAVAHIDDVLGQLGIEIRGKGRRGRPTRADGMLPKKIGRPKGSKNKPKGGDAQQVSGGQAQGAQDELPSRRGRSRAKLGRRAKARGRAKPTKRGRPEPSEPMPRKKIGRPKGSKNKPKAVPIDVLGVEAQVQQVQQAQQSVPAEQVQQATQEVHDGLPSRRGKKIKD